MPQSLATRFNIVYRAVTPALLTIFLVLFGALPIGLPDFAVVTPAYALMSVFYWSIHRPGLMPAPLVFFIGLLQDVLTGAPLGMGAVVLLGVHGISASQRKVFLGKSFLVGWWGFMLVAGGAGLLSWIIACVYYTTLLDPLPLLLRYLLTLALYPLITWVLVRTQRWIQKAA